MYMLKQHMALAGLNIDKSKYLHSNGGDIQQGEDNFIQRDDTLGIVYERKRLIRDARSSRHMEFAIKDKDGNHYTRKAILATVPFDINIVTNQLLDLDNFELLHRLELAHSSFEFTLNLPDTPEERLQFLMSYSDLSGKANEALTQLELRNGFHLYNFGVNIQGYLLAPYTTTIDIVTKVDFNLIFTNDVYAGTEPEESNSVRIIIE
jgi:hypothetical protein